MPETKGNKQRGLYRVKASELPVLASYMAKNFFYDPLFDLLLEGEEGEEKFLKMEQYFLLHLKEFYLPSKIYSLNKELKSAMVVFDSLLGTPKTDSKISVLQDTKKFVREVGIPLQKCKPFILYDTHKIMVQDWIKDMVDGRYLHVELFFVDESVRGQGIFRKLFTPLLRFADQRGLPITLETHNFENCEKYKALGFQLVGAIKSKYSDLTQYCLIRE